MTSKKSIFQGLWASVSDAPDTAIAAPVSRVSISGRALRIAVSGATYQIDLGRERLHLEPDVALDENVRRRIPAFLVTNPQKASPGMRYGVRLGAGERVQIGGPELTHSSLFVDPSEASRYRLQIAHEGDTLVVGVGRGDAEVGLTAVEDGDWPASIERRRRALEDVMRIYGGALAPLPADLALQTLQSVCDLLREECYREPNADGLPGGILTLPSSVTPVIVGDLHANVDNLLKVLSTDGMLEGLERGSAVLLLLGDVAHRDVGDELEELNSSVLLMDLVLRLKRRYPEAVFLLLGNHESFSPDVMKGGVAQGVLWEHHLRKNRGDAYRDAMATFYDRLPVIAVSSTFLACHAGAPRRRTTREMLRDVRHHPALLHELTWNRFRSRRSPAGYTAGDVRRLRKTLEVERSAPFIVGHQPCSDTDTLWLNVGRIDDHHVIYSSRTDEIGLFTQVDGRIVPQTLSAEPLVDWVNTHLLD